MARNTDTIDYTNDYYTGVSKIYFDKILQTIIDFGDLQNEEGIILDYGCGVGHFKKKLGKANVIGYDIVPELSDVDDYKSVDARKIVLASVLEHLYLDDIESLLQDFLSMGSVRELLVSLPTENFVSKIAMHLAGQANAHDDHVSTYKEINKLIERYFTLKERKFIFFRMSQVSRYVLKGSED